MPINRLDHVSIRTQAVEETRRFYSDVLGFEVGPRPDFPFPGAWLYHNGVAVVHVVGIDPNDKAGLAAYLGDKDIGDAKGTGVFDHVAFVASDFDAVRSRIAATGVAMRERDVPNMKLRQIFVEDPNGVTIELNFPGA